MESKTMAEQVAPTANRFKLHGQMGLSTVLEPKASVATAELIENLAKIIDHQERLAWARRELIKSVGWLVAWVLAVIALAVASA